MLLLAVMTVAMCGQLSGPACSTAIKNLCSASNTSRQVCLQCASDNANQLINLCSNLNSDLESACGYAPQPVPTGFACSGLNSSSISLRWHGAVSHNADVFDVELSTNKFARPIALQTTALTELIFDSLRADTAYFFKMRGHSAAAPSLVAGWSKFTPTLQCATTPNNENQDKPNDGRRTERSKPPTKLAVNSRLYKVYRWSEGTELVDLLENHNSGDLLGEAVSKNTAG
jgi:hypothetical protein